MDPGDALPDHEPARLGDLTWRGSLDALSIAGRIKPTENSSAVDASAALKSVLAVSPQATVDHLLDSLAARDDLAHIDNFVAAFVAAGSLDAERVAGRSRRICSSVNYGAVPKDTAKLLADSIVASYGGKDISLRSDPQRLHAALDTVGIAHDVKIYPDAGHAFLNDHDDIPDGRS